MPPSSDVVQLTQPKTQGDVTLEYTLQHRRTIRDFSKTAISLTDLSQLLWAAQGITSAEGFRTAPSAGALYPLEIYIVVGNVNDLSPGIYRYQPVNHQIYKIVDGDLRKQISKIALNQRWINHSSAVLVFTSVPSRTTRKYGKRGIRYIHIETGHAAQNVFLQAVALELGAAVVGAFNDEKLDNLLGLSKGKESIYLMPIGKSRKH